ncbi:MAG: hypothetical protein ACO3OK_01945, partial [Limisphaerales bacterium]
NAYQSRRPRRQGFLVILIVKRDIDDGYGKVQTVQRKTSHNLEAFLKLVREDCKLDIPPTTGSDDLQIHMRNQRVKRDYKTGHVL